MQIGDRLYARNEFDPNGPIELKAIEEVFVRQGIVLELTVGGLVIGTTAEHPFYAYGRGWTPAHELTVGELIATADGRWLPIEKSYNTGNLETVYNFRIADHHTYFVGDDSWGFEIWVHNSYRDANNRLHGDDGRFVFDGGRKPRSAAGSAHGNSHSTDKIAQGYTLVDKHSLEPLHYGETTLGENRYTKAYLKTINARMVFGPSGTKKEMHQWQHKQIMDYKAATGFRPPLNFNDY